MNKSITVVFISCSLLSNFSAFSMDQAKKPSCEEQLYQQLSGGNLERMFTASRITTRTFTPFTSENFEEAKINFAKKGVIVTKILVSLQENAHLVQVAKRANLNGLCIVENDRQDLDGTVQDAFTGVSITRFKNAAIYHAIALPQLPDQINNNPSKRASIVQGMIEREIARISKAYTPEDDELTQWKHMLCTRISYGIGSGVLGLCFPPSLLLSIPLGYLGASVQKEITQLSLEVAADREAVALAQRSDNLIATLETANEFIHECNKKDAEELKENNGNFSQRVQRIHVLLKAQDELKKKE